MSSRKNKSLELIFTGIVIGFVCGMPLGLGLFSEVANHIETVLVATIVTLAIFGVLIILVYVFKDRIFKWLKIRLTKHPSEIKNGIKELSQGIVEKDNEKIESVTGILTEQLFGTFIWFRIRKWMFNTFIGIIVAFTGLAGSALLYQQNKILTAQEQWFIRQSESADNQSIEATRTSLFNHAIEIQKLLIANPKLIDYFYNKKEIGNELNKEEKQKAGVIAEMLCDMLDHASDSKILAVGTREGWNIYANDMMENSPIFREYLLNHKDWYPSIGKWIDYKKYE